MDRVSDQGTYTEYSLEGVGSADAGGRWYADTQGCGVSSEADNPKRTVPQRLTSVAWISNGCFASGVATRVPFTIMAAPTFNLEISAKFGIVSW